MERTNLNRRLINKKCIKWIRERNTIEDISVFIMKNKWTYPKNE